MQGEQTPNAETIEAALRQLPAGAERLLRARFGIGTASPRWRAAVSTLPRQRLRALETAAFRRLRMNAVSTRFS